jgi:hypothetical protein
LGSADRVGSNCLAKWLRAPEWAATEAVSAEMGSAKVVGPNTVAQVRPSVEKGEMMRKNEKVMSDIDVLTVGDEMVSPSCPERSNGAAESFNDFSTKISPK